MLLPLALTGMGAGWQIGPLSTLINRDTPDPLMGEGMELYLGAWGHMLAASGDLIDMVHNHPLGAVDARGNAEKDLQFDLAFPRAGVYRVWVQFQRLGVVNTVAFNIPVEDPPQ
jgi:hypothetical protein